MKINFYLWLPNWKTGNFGFLENRPVTPETTFRSWGKTYTIAELSKTVPGVTAPTNYASYYVAALDIRKPTGLQKNLGFDPVTGARIQFDTTLMAWRPADTGRVIANEQHIASENKRARTRLAVEVAAAGGLAYFAAGSAAGAASTSTLAASSSATDAAAGATVSTAAAAGGAAAGSTAGAVLSSGGILGTIGSGLAAKAGAALTNLFSGGGGETPSATDNPPTTGSSSVVWLIGLAVLLITIAFIMGRR